MVMPNLGGDVACRQRRSISLTLLLARAACIRATRSVSVFGVGCASAWLAIAAASIAKHTVLITASFSRSGATCYNAPVAESPLDNPLQRADRRRAPLA